jgi:hypothetical protein
LKENILMGRLIPAGTGFASYQKLGMVIDGEDAAATDDMDGSQSFSGLA